MRETGLQLVNVSLITLGIHMLHVDQSVLSTLIVHRVKLVNSYIALIHAQELVVSMLIAEFKIIFQLALALKDTLEILSQHVD